MGIKPFNIFFGRASYFFLTVGRYRPFPCIIQKEELDTVSVFITAFW